VMSDGLFVPSWLTEDGRSGAEDLD
jgi:hypothetical protein